MTGSSTVKVAGSPLKTGRLYVFGLIFSSVLLSLLSIGLEFVFKEEVNRAVIGRTAIQLILLYNIWSGGLKSLWIMRALILLASALVLFRVGDSPLWLTLLLVGPLTFMSFFAFSSKTFAYVQNKQGKNL